MHPAKVGEGLGFSIVDYERCDDNDATVLISLEVICMLIAVISKSERFRADLSRSIQRVSIKIGQQIWSARTGLVSQFDKYWYSSAQARCCNLLKRLSVTVTSSMDFFHPSHLLQVSFFYFLRLPTLTPRCY